MLAFDIASLMLPLWQVKNTWHHPTALWCLLYSLKAAKPREIWTQSCWFITLGTTFTIMLNSMGILFTEFKGLDWYLEADVSRRIHLPVLESSWVPRAKRAKNVNLYRILLVYLSLKGTLGDAVYTGSYNRRNQHRSQLNIKQTSGGDHHVNPSLVKILHATCLSKNQSGESFNKTNLSALLQRQRSTRSV